MSGERKSGVERTGWLFPEHVRNKEWQSQKLQVAAGLSLRKVQNHIAARLQRATRGS